jgi:citrate synthase
MPQENRNERKNKGFQSLVSNDTDRSKLQDGQTQISISLRNYLPSETALELAAKAKLVEGVAKLASQELPNQAPEMEDEVMDQLEVEVPKAVLLDDLQKLKAEAQQKQQQAALQQQLLEEKKQQQEEMEKRRRAQLNLSKSSILKNAVKAGASPLDVFPPAGLFSRFLKKILP